MVTVDGQVFAAGDSRYAFAIESISEVCSLALALEQHGPDEIEKKIRADASGLSFHSVSTLELHGDRPLGPLVNAGALTMISVVEATDAQPSLAPAQAPKGRNIPAQGNALGMTDNRPQP